MTTNELSSNPEGTKTERLIAPWWHTALMVLMILGLSIQGAQQVRHAGNHQLHLASNYMLTIAYEWVLAGLALWGIWMRKVPLRQLLGERRPGSHASLVDIAVALSFWAASLVVLGILGEVLVKVSGSHIDPQKIGDVTQKLAPVTGWDMLLFLMLSISAGFCEELVFRGYLQQQFSVIGRSTAAGVAISAAVFGGAHGYEGIAGVLLIAVYGAMFGVLALKRRSLRAGMIAHGWHDAVSGAALVLLRHYGVHLTQK